MRALRHWTITAAAAMALLAPSVGVAPARAATTYTVVDLGTLGGRQSMAEAVNASGVVVGQAQTPDGAWHGFIWDAGRGMRSLGTGVHPTGIDDDGRVVGYLDDATAFSARGDPPVIEVLPMLSGGQANATAVDATGGVTGGSFAAGDGWRAVRWSGAGGPTLLDGPGVSSDGMAINVRGDVAGQYVSDSDGGGRRSMLWTAGTSVDLGMLPGASGMLAEGMNDAGEVVGWATGGPYSRGFLYRAASGTLVDLGSLPGRKGAGLRPQDVNNHGVIVGFATNGVAFVKTATGPITDLATLVGKHPGVRPKRALAVNDAGQIVGFGGALVADHAFLLTPR
ncbi:MAG TPA: hypothetical protein VFO65_09995 [Acidimicrobiales bacterium]|nr:hypothetical protein [Acidimicrobiales bacterium]